MDWILKFKPFAVILKKFEIDLKIFNLNLYKVIIYNTKLI